MNAKIFKLLLFLCLFVALPTFSQTQIEGFWGIKLGEPESTVVTKVKQKYPNAKYEQYTSGKEFVAPDVNIAGIDVNCCCFTFRNGIFTKAVFAIGNTVPDFFKSMNHVQNFFDSVTANVQNYYAQFYERMQNKYGAPSISSSSSTTWRTSNGNSITISTYKNYNYLPGVGYSPAMGVQLTYSLGTNSTDY